MDLTFDLNLNQIQAQISNLFEFEISSCQRRSLTNKIIIYRPNENSLLSEAINAVNINSSILSNEPMVSKMGNNCQGSQLFQRQEVENEFKLPLQIRRLDSTLSKSQIR